jgi:hypothetical protein
MARYSISLYLAVHIICAWWGADTAAGDAEFYSVVERNGTVVLCLSKGAILFADRCAGDGRLTIVEPIKEGPVVWRSVTGTVSLENETANPDCALGQAKWDSKTEKAVSTGRKITKADRAALLQKLTSHNFPAGSEFVEGDITAFTIDLDNDGKEEIVFAASNLDRVAKLWASDQKTRLYAVYAGIMPVNSDFPSFFFTGHGSYEGGTDSFDSATLKGVVSISPGTGEIAVLAEAGDGFSGKQSLIRYWHGTVLKIDTILRTCD